MTPRKTTRRGDWDIELDAWIKTAQVFFFLGAFVGGGLIYIAMRIAND